MNIMAMTTMVMMLISNVSLTLHGVTNVKNIVIHICLKYA